MDQPLFRAGAGSTFSAQMDARLTSGTATHHYCTVSANSKQLDRKTLDVHAYSKPCRNAANRSAATGNEGFQHLAQQANCILSKLPSFATRAGRGIKLSKKDV